MTFYCNDGKYGFEQRECATLAYSLDRIQSDKEKTSNVGIPTWLYYEYTRCIQSLRNDKQKYTIIYSANENNCFLLLQQTIKITERHVANDKCEANTYRRQNVSSRFCFVNCAAWCMAEVNLFIFDMHKCDSIIMSFVIFYWIVVSVLHLMEKKKWESDVLGWLHSTTQPNVVTNLCVKFNF